MKVIRNHLLILIQCFPICFLLDLDFEQSFRIFVDSVVNHMAGLGRSGTGSAGTSFDSDSYDFPGVPYGPDDFTPRDMCPSGDGMD